MSRDCRKQERRPPHPRDQCSAVCGRKGPAAAEAAGAARPRVTPPMSHPLLSLEARRPGRPRLETGRRRPLDAWTRDAASGL